MAEHDSSKEKYGTPQKVNNPLGNNGYPNNVANTQTVKTRGTGAATRGTHSSKKLG